MGFRDRAGVEAKLEWMRQFVRDEIIPLETLADRWRSEEGRAVFRQITDPLKDEVRRQGLWAAHLPPDMGGQGFGQVKLGLMHEILGQCAYAPSVFGNQAPDSGNAELISVGGTGRAARAMDATVARRQGAQQLLDDRAGCGRRPTLLKTTAIRDGGEWLINGHKWFSSNASISDFLVVMVKTGDHDQPYKNFSMIIVPTNTPGVAILRDVPTMGEPDHRTGEPGGHAEILYRDVRVPFDNIVGGEAGIGQGFALAPEASRPGPHSSRDALVGPEPSGVRHAVRAGADPVHPRFDPGREADGAGLDRRELRRDAGRQAAHVAGGVEDGPAARCREALQRCTAWRSA